MDTRLRNKYIRAAALILCSYLLALTLLSAFDMIKNRGYITKNSYFNSTYFTNRLSTFYDKFYTFYTNYDNYPQRSVEEKLSKEEAASIQGQYKEILKAEEKEIHSEYDRKISDLQLKGKKEEVIKLTEERDTKLKNAEQESQIKINEALKSSAGAKDIEYENLKNSLYNDSSIKFYFVNAKNKEVYTNLEGISNIEEYLANNTLYSIKFPQDFLRDRSLIRINNFFKSASLDGYLIIPKKTSGYSQIYADIEYFNSIRNRLITEGVIFIISLSAGSSIFFYFIRKKLYDIGIIGRAIPLYNKIPIDLRVILFALFLFTTLNYTSEMSFFYKPITINHFYKITAESVLMAFVIFSITNLFILMRNGAELKRQFSQSICCKYLRVVKASLVNKIILFKVILLVLLTIVFGIFVSLMFNGFIRREDDLTLISSVYILIYLLTVPYYFLSKVGMLNKVLKGTEEVVSGNLNYSIEEEVGGELLRLIQNINNMKLGFKKSLESQMKSERLKAELITNVSHDLKTPLTSIINYIDLLKREDISKDEIDSYIGVLDRKATRLKALIDDLFEASKMASGSVELNIERVDVGALLFQALAEFDEKIKNSSLKFKVDAEHQKFYANLDGRKTWRVFENLINNALKYSHPGTRVYLGLTEQEDKIIFTIKNVSSYEMDFNVDEIFERFKRGDKARSTEGSGLGLAIAKSIMELQGGKLGIEIDGDLFKATVEFMK